MAPLLFGDAVDKVLAAVEKHTSGAGRMDSKALGEATRYLYSEVQSMKPALGAIGAGLKAYHAHVLRGRWQQAAIKAIEEKADGKTVVLLVDYMMVSVFLL